MSVVNGMVFVGEFGQERAQSSRHGGRIPPFLAEVEIELHPFVLRLTKRRGNFGFVQAAVDTSHPFCGQFIHGNV